MSRARILSATLALACASPISAPAATLLVPSEYPTIQAGIDASVAGDTVLVGPGVWSDYQIRTVSGIPTAACVFLKANVTVLSEAGPEATSIDMLQAEIPTIPKVVVHGRHLGDPGAVLEGFTVTGIYPGNGGLALVGSGRCVFQECIIRDMESEDVPGITAVRVDLDVIDCQFLRCVGNSISAINHRLASLLVSGCTFEDNVGTAVSANADFGVNDFGVVIEDSQFLHNRDLAGSGGAVGAVNYYEGADIRRCVFIDNESRFAGGAIYGTFATIEDCVFFDNRSIESAGGAIFISGTCAIRRSTIVQSSGAPNITDGSAVGFGGGIAEGILTFENNIIAWTTGNVAFNVYEGTAVGGCNVFWSNLGGDAAGYVLGPTDRIVDPLFCDRAVGDLTLNSASPCLPVNSFGCGLIGALPQGCGTISVESKSWGSIKGLWR